MNSSTAYIGYRDASRLVGIKLGTLYSLVSKKAIPHYRISSRLVLFDKVELENWVKSRLVVK